MQFKRTLPLFITAVMTLALAGVPAAMTDDGGNMAEAECLCGNVAIDGYSPVSYFTQGRAVRGSAEFAVVHGGKTYHLTSEDEQRLFVNNPDRYLPEYDGWCALGIAVNQYFPIDPENFKIVDGRLLLFLNSPEEDALQIWNDGDEAQLLRDADTNWVTMRQTVPM